MFAGNDAPAVLVPASERARGLGVRWYEANVSRSGSLSLTARGASGQMVSRIDGKPAGRSGIALTIVMGDSQMTLETQISRGPAKGLALVSVKMDGQEAMVSSTDDNQGQIELSETWTAALNLWQEGPDLFAMLSAHERSQSDSGHHCGSCLLLGAGVSVGAGLCAGTLNPAACGLTLTAGGLFIESCEGACA